MELTKKEYEQLCFSIGIIAGAVITLDPEEKDMQLYEHIDIIKTILNITI